MDIHGGARRSRRPDGARSHPARRPGGPAELRPLGGGPVGRRNCPQPLLHGREDPRLRRRRRLPADSPWWAAWWHARPPRGVPPRGRKPAVLRQGLLALRAGARHVPRRGWHVRLQGHCAAAGRPLGRYPAELRESHRVLSGGMHLRRWPLDRQLVAAVLPGVRSARLERSNSRSGRGDKHGRALRAARVHRTGRPGAWGARRVQAAGHVLRPCRRVRGVRGWHHVDGPEGQCLEEHDVFPALQLSPRILRVQLGRLCPF
mmetsp:Transcript_18676/g.51243  ORF Transcript_18676/g.51243 Transcript_18676/m.51243 type:complete len:260 (-) Transcript_18676:152-931(-)